VGASRHRVGESVDANLSGRGAESGEILACDARDESLLALRAAEGRERGFRDEGGDEVAEVRVVERRVERDVVLARARDDGGERGASAAGLPELAVVDVRRDGV